MSELLADGSIDFAITEADGNEVAVNVSLRDGEYIARDADGRTVARVRGPRDVSGL